MVCEKDESLLAFLADALKRGNVTNAPRRMYRPSRHYSCRLHIGEQTVEIIIPFRVMALLAEIADGNADN